MERFHAYESGFLRDFNTYASHILDNDGESNGEIKQMNENCGS